MAIPAVLSVLMALSQACSGSDDDLPDAASAERDTEGATTGMRQVLLVGNSVSGTVSFIDAHSFKNLGTVDVLSDIDAVMDDINSDFVRSIAYPMVRNAQLLHHFEPSDGDRFVDDVFVSPDGTRLYVSRSNLGDVAEEHTSTACAVDPTASRSRAISASRRSMCPNSRTAK